MKKRFSICLICMLLLTYLPVTTAKAAEPSLPSGASYDKIGSLIEAFVDSHQKTTAAMEMAVVTDNTILYQNCFGYADIKKQLPADAMTVFEWGSVSKLLVWTSVMQLWEQGLLDLNADITTYLPKHFLTNLSFETPITMKHLMNHNAGFQEILTGLFVSNETEILPLSDALLSHPPAQIYEPGTVTAYSNWSTSLAAYIVEQISGIPYSEYVKKHIFEPLHMEHTAIAADLSDNAWVKQQRQSLQCYTTDLKLIKNHLCYIPLYPAGMCTGILSDFIVFCQALIPSSEHAPVLFEKEQTLTEMLSATNTYPDTGLALNCHGFWCAQFEVPVMTHSGNTAGCSAGLFFDPKSRIGLVIMTNQQNESIYNQEMPKLIFGSFQNSALSNYNETFPKGVFRSARTIRKGPLSIYGCAVYVPSSRDLDSFWVYENTASSPRVASIYSDLLKVPAKEYIPMFALLFSMIAGCIYSLFTLIGGGCILRLRNHRKQRSQGIVPVPTPLRSLNYFACGLFLLFLVNIIALYVQLVTYAPPSHYLWQFGAFGVFAAGMLIFPVTLLLRWHSLAVPAKTKVKYIFTAFFSLMFSAAVLYWHMYEFWAL